MSDFEKTIIVPGDDDCFYSSKIYIHFVARGCDGVTIVVKPQLDSPDTVFLHTGEIKTLIDALKTTLRLIEKHGQVARDGGYVCMSCRNGPCYALDEVYTIFCDKPTANWTQKEASQPKEGE